MRSKNDFLLFLGYEHLNYEFENDENQQHNHRSHFQSDTNHLNLTEEQFMYSNNNINQDPFNIKKETDEDLDLNYKDEQDILFPGKKYSKLSINTSELFR